MSQNQEPPTKACSLWCSFTTVSPRQKEPHFQKLGWTGHLLRGSSSHGQQGGAAESSARKAEEPQEETPKPQKKRGAPSGTGQSLGTFLTGWIKLHPLPRRGNALFCGRILQTVLPTMLGSPHGRPVAMTQLFSGTNYFSIFFWGLPH